MTEQSPTAPTVRQLRRRWKPHKEHLLASQSDHPNPIRFHRACSWLARVEQLDDGADYDFALLCQWTAFNALYGQWDSRAREPKADRASWRAFLDKILTLDSDGRVSRTLTENKRLVMSLLEDEYLSSYFWKDPSDKRASQSKKAKYDARTWYIEKRWTMILDRLLERVYLMRCQLVHGAATYGGKLNRTSLRRSVTMMGHLLPAVLLVWIDHGSGEDWGTLCYPPLGR